MKGDYSLAFSSFHNPLLLPSIPPPGPPTVPSAPDPSILLPYPRHRLRAGPQHVGIAATSQPRPEWLSAGCHARRGTHAFSSRCFTNISRFCCSVGQVLSLTCQLRPLVHFLVFKTQAYASSVPEQKYAFFSWRAFGVPNFATRFSFNFSPSTD